MVICLTSMCVECYKRACWRLNNCPLDRILCFTGNEKLRTKDEKCTLKDYVSTLIFLKQRPRPFLKAIRMTLVPHVNSLSCVADYWPHLRFVDQGAVMEYRHIFMKSLLSWLPFSRQKLGFDRNKMYGEQAGSAAPHYRQSLAVLARPQPCDSFLQ